MAMTGNAMSSRTPQRAARIAVYRTMIPLFLVTGFAMVGQIAFGIDEYAPQVWDIFWRVIVAIGAAVAVESIGLYVQWHAHDALLMGASATAARLRRASYAIALGVAAVNYYHFSNAWSPTPGAVVFALFSASSPWLWGLHTRRVQRVQLLREGKVDSTGAVFSAERWRAFPILTWQARRWSIFHGVSDPLDAWQQFIEARRDDDPDDDIDDDDDALGFSQGAVSVNLEKLTFTPDAQGRFEPQTAQFGSPAVINPTNIATRRRSTNGTGTTTQRRAWISKQLDNGKNINGGDVDREFGGRNGARLLRQVKEERAQSERKEEGTS